MNTIIYLLLAITILYVLYYRYKVGNIEMFTNSENPENPANSENEENLDEPGINNTIINQPLNTPSDVAPIGDNTVTEGAMDESVDGLLRQLEILKKSMPKTNKIVQSDFKGPNAFIPYVINNLNKITEAQSDNFKQNHEIRNEKVKIFNEKLKSFRDQLELEAGRDMNTVKSISSSQNGQPLTVMPVANNNHMVIINNKCLSANSVGLYDLADCNYLEPKQHFKLNPVYHDIDYNINLAPSSKKAQNGKDADGNVIRYPFVLVKSHTSGNCLINTDGQVYMGPCKAKTEHRWNPSTSMYKCKAPE